MILRIQLLPGQTLRTRPRANPPGAQFYYNTGDTFLLSHILSRATGMKVADYCSLKLWRPFGFEQDGFFILDSDDGHEVVGSCSGAALRDYARWGLFMLADCVIDGKRVVPEGWVKDCTTATAPNFAFDFGGERGVAGGADSAYKGYFMVGSRGRRLSGARELRPMDLRQPDEQCRRGDPRRRAASRLHDQGRIGVA